MDEETSEERPTTEPNTIPIADLPDELLAHVMSYLSFYDRKLSRLVCKRWNEVSYSRSLIKNDWLVLPSVPALKELENLPPHWKFFNLRINTVEHQYEETKLWEKFGPMITKIELIKSSMQNPVLVDILKFCANLRSLSLIGCVPRRIDGVSFAESGPFLLPKLECLALQDVVNLTDNEFNALTKNAENLTAFQMNDYYFIDHDCFGVEEEDEVEDRWNDEFVKISSLISLMSRQSTRLTHFQIFLTDLPGETLIEILSTIGNHIKYLKTTIGRGNALDTSSSIQAISQNCQNLETLDLTLSILNGENITAILSSLKNVKKLIFGLLSDFGAGLGALSSLEFLREIDLSNCRGINQADLMVLGRQPMPNVEVLSLEGMPCVNDEVILAISPMYPNLICWSLGKGIFGDVGFSSIVKNNKLLQRLDIYYCKGLTTVNGINDLTELRMLNMGGCTNVSIPSIACLSLKKLQRLSLRGLEINDHLETIVKACPSLEHVYVNGTTNLNVIRPTIHCNVRRVRST